MDAKVTWHEGMSFTGTADTGFNVPLGADSGVGGKDDGFRPMELLLVGLAGCTGMDVISILSKKRQNVSNFEVLVHADRATEHPKVFTEIMIEYIVSGKDIDPVAVERAVQLSEEKYCPAQAMFVQIAKIDHKITIIQE
ncbi:MAG: OsmC family protein [Anaerolineaceae bacterium]